MPPAFVQKVAEATSGTETGTRTLTVGAGITTTAGHMLSLWSRCTAGAVITGVTDSAGNAWQVDKTGTVSSAVTSLASCILAAGKALATGSTITVAFSVAGENSALGCAEYSGVASVGGMPVVDQVATVNNAVAGPVTAATTADSQAGGLVVCCVGSASNPATFTLTTADPDSGGTWAQLSYPGAGTDCAYQLGPASPTLFSCTWTPSGGNGNSTIASYKAPGVVTGSAGGLFPLLAGGGL